MRKIIFDVVVVVYIIVTVFVTACLLSYNDYDVSKFGDTSFIIADKDFSKFKKNDLIIVSKKSLDNAKNGDQVLYYKKSDDNEVISVSKIKEINKISEKETAYDLEDESRLSSKYIIGTVSDAKAFSVFGNILNVLESKWGYLLIIIFPIFLAFFYEMLNEK